MESMFFTAFNIDFIKVFFIFSEKNSEGRVDPRMGSPEDRIL